MGSAVRWSVHMYVHTYLMMLPANCLASHKTRMVHTSVNTWLKHLLLTNYSTDMDQIGYDASGQQSLMGLCFQSRFVPYNGRERGVCPKYVILFKNVIFRNHKTDPDQSCIEASGLCTKLNLNSSWLYLPRNGATHPALNPPFRLIHLLHNYMSDMDQF